MALSLTDKIALIYTSAGSMREVGRRLGISHQKVGRILRSGVPGFHQVTARVTSDPALIDSVNQAFRIHSHITKAQARADNLPFTPAAPIFNKRLTYVKKEQYIVKSTGEIKSRVKRDKDGRPEIVKGERAEAAHLHFVSDELRNKWLAFNAKSQRFYNASIGSIVNLKDYNRKADTRARENAKKGVHRTKDQMRYAAHLKAIQKEIKESGSDNYLARVQTRYTRFNGQEDWAIPYQIAEMTDQVKRKHETAAFDQHGESVPGAALADRILFQIDTRLDKNADKKPRTRGSKPRQSKRAK